MRHDKLFAFLAVLFFVAIAPSVAYAGGPLVLFDPATGAPYKYKGPVKVYTDLGTLGRLSNDAADAQVAFAWRQWTDVPSSSFEATVEGDFSTLGLADTTSANASQIFNTYNGGGIHVVYDTNGTILRDYFGVGTGVLGIAGPEVSVEGTDEIVESWVILNGLPIAATDPTGTKFAGVMTHEFGHSINLAHSQTNGAIVFNGDVTGPAGCTTLPYSGAPTYADLETMFPFINVAQSGVAQSTVDHADDIASISNLYPAPDYASTFGSITGTILAGGDNAKITGVNVIARNVANPWRDAVSALSGDYTQGLNGPDGLFTLRGLTPGAQYVVYVDGIVNGGFSTPPALVLPGQEEFYNGVAESGDWRSDAACDATPITAVAGSPVTADIILNEDEEAPKLTVLGAGIAVTDISADGTTIVGIFNGQDAPAFRYTDEGGLVNIGGVGGFPSITHDGSRIIANALNPADANRKTASIWDGREGWMPLPGLGVSGVSRSSGYGITDDGSVAVGLAYTRPKIGAVKERAFRWDAATNSSSILETPDTSLQSRASGISADGSLIYGYHTAGGPREAALWLNGTTFTRLLITRSVGTAPPITFSAGEALGMNAAGTIVVGGALDVDPANPDPFWRWTPTDGVQEISGMRGFATTSALAVNEAGSVIVGFGKGKQYPWGFDNGIREGFIWIRGLGLIPLADFLTVQGTRTTDGLLVGVPNAMSASGQRIIGGGVLLPFGTPVTWTLDIKTVNLCHATPGRPSDVSTIKVHFPEGIEEHLEHGDTLGDCVTVSNRRGNGGH